MATFKEVDHSAVNGSDQELPAQEDEAAGEQTPERRHVDALLEISEEDFMKELEPYEYHCYSGWEDAVHGWTRVAPMSCILLPLKRHRKPKHKEADKLTPLSVDPAIPDADSSASIAEQHCESHVGPHNSFKKSISLNQHMGSCRNTAAPAEWPVLNAMEKTTSGEETPLQPHHLPSKYLNRPAKPQKQRPNNTVVPITNFTFLPPIKSPHLNPQNVSDQLCSGKKAPEGESIEENCFVFEKKSWTRGTRVDRIAHTELPTSSAIQTSKYWTCQYNPHLFSAVSVSIPRRYQEKPDTVHQTSYSVDKSLTQALHPSTATGAPAHMYPSNTVCM